MGLPEALRHIESDDGHALGALLAAEPELIREPAPARPGWTLLFEAARDDRLDALAALLTAGVPTELGETDPTNGLQTPLIHALYDGQPRAAAALAEHGPHPDCLVTAVGLRADISRFFARGELLPQGLDPGGDLDAAWTLDEAFVMACRVWSPDHIDQLLARGADPNGRDRWGETGLHQTVCHGEEQARALLARGATVAVRDWQYVASPIGWADEFGKETLRDLLLDEGAPDIVDAISYGRLARVEEILAAEPAMLEGQPWTHAGWLQRVRDRDHAGAPHPATQGARLGEPLRVAAALGGVNTARRLLELGARTDHSEVRTGIFESAWLARTALGWAIAEGHDAIAHQLTDAGAELDLLQLAALGQVSALGPPADSETLGDALFLAAMGGHLETCARLLAVGAPVDHIPTFDQQLRTPLCVAIQASAELTRLLLEAGADRDTATLGNRRAGEYGGPGAVALDSASS